MSDSHQCGFTNGGPCPSAKKCVFPRCGIEYSGSPVWAALKQVVMFNEATAPKPELNTRTEEKPSLPREDFD